MDNHDSKDMKKWDPLSEKGISMSYACTNQPGEIHFQITVMSIRAQLPLQIDWWRNKVVPCSVKKQKELNGRCGLHK